MKRLFVAFLFTFAAVAGVASASRAEPGSIPAYVASAVADPRRPSDQVARDKLRHPAEVIAFAGIKPGDKIVDFMPGTGYFTRLFSAVVGAKGHVYAINPGEFAGFGPEMKTLAADRSYANLTLLLQPVEKFAPPESVDVVWTSLNYHDLHDSFMNGADVATVNRAVFKALKPGGTFLVIDHAAQAGSGLRDTETLHRIDPAAIVKEVTAAGFMLVGESKLLRNAADNHTLHVANAAIRGHTDQVIYRFRKPA